MESHSNRVEPAHPYGQCSWHVAPISTPVGGTSIPRVSPCDVLKQSLQVDVDPGELALPPPLATCTSYHLVCREVAAPTAILDQDGVTGLGMLAASQLTSEFCTRLLPSKAGRQEEVSSVNGCAIGCFSHFL